MLSFIIQIRQFRYRYRLFGLCCFFTCEYPISNFDIFVVILLLNCNVISKIKCDSSSLLTVMCSHSVAGTIAHWVSRLFSKASSSIQLCGAVSQEQVLSISNSRRSSWHYHSVSHYLALSCFMSVAGFALSRSKSKCCSLCCDYG